MTLPQFLLMILTVILAAGATLWLASGSGLPMAALGLAALVGAGLTRLALVHRNPHG